MTIKYDFSELEEMLRLGVRDLEIKNGYILLTPKVSSYYLYMQTK